MNISELPKWWELQANDLLTKGVVTDKDAAKAAIYSLCASQLKQLLMPRPDPIGEALNTGNGTYKP